MKRVLLLVLPAVLLIAACGDHKQVQVQPTNDTLIVTPDSLPVKSGYSEVNGLKMYYEIYGEGKPGNPLVLIHGGGSTIQSTFGRVIPELAKRRKLVAVELQAHGRTGDRNADLSFEQDADDVVRLLGSLQIDKADLFGFSNGGTTALQVAIRHPEVTGKVIAASALCNREGVPQWFWDFIKEQSLENMPVQLKQSYLEVSPDSNGLQVMHDKDAKRMLNFKDIPDEKLKSIHAPVFIVSGDSDVIKPEHAVEMHRMIPNSVLAIIPGGHGEYMGEITTIHPGTENAFPVINMIENFLDKEDL